VRDRFLPTEEWAESQTWVTGEKKEKRERLERVPLVLKVEKYVQSLLTLAPCFRYEGDLLSKEKSVRFGERENGWIQKGPIGHCFDVT
jgi:hypothetical protein